MSLQQFQQALAAMTIEPQFAAEVRHTGAPALQDYVLSPREEARLVAVSRQPGMALNCTLARGNRFGPLFDVYPLVCTLLMPSLRALLDGFWRAHRPDNYQLSGEEDAFAAFLSQQLASGAFTHPYLREVLDYESACWELVRASRHEAVGAAHTATAALSRDIRFTHDPRQLLPPLQRGNLPPEGLPPAPCWLRVRLDGDALVAEVPADPAQNDAHADNPQHATPPHDAARWQPPALD